MAEEKPKSKPTRLLITSCVAVYTGKNRRGDEYTIYEVKACKESGETIEEKLTSFEDLPVELLDVTVTPYDSAEHGRSYTLARQGRVSTSRQIKELRGIIDGLVERVVELERRMPAPPIRGESVQPAAAPSQPAQEQPPPDQVQADLDRHFAVE